MPLRRRRRLSMRSNVILCTYLLAAFCQAQSDPTCDMTALALLEKDIPAIPQALQVLGDCFNYLDSTSFKHTKNDGTSYCTTDPKESPELQLAHMESHLASIEADQGSYCCSVEECAATCPPSSTKNTCNTNDSCKPHAPAFIKTLEVKPRIQNIANRLQAVKPFVDNPGESPCPSGPSSTTTSSTPQGQPTTTQPIEVTGLDGATQLLAQKRFSLKKR